MIIRLGLTLCFSLVVVGCAQKSPTREARALSAPESEWIERICVDEKGRLDQNIATGFWRQKDWDIDLNGDRRAERVVVFYLWQKWGSTPEEAAVNFDKSNGHDDGYGNIGLVNAILILERREGSLVPASYFFWDEDGTGLTIEHSPVSSLPFLSCGGGRDQICHAWGATKVGGSIAPLDGAESMYGLSQWIPRFAVRSGYPQ